MKTESLDLRRRGASIFKAFLLAATLCATLGAARAQDRSTTGSIGGTITDVNGAAVPSAIVTVTGASLGAPRTATTNEEGLYKVDNLTPGQYAVRVELSGFKAANVEDVQVNVGRESTISLKLEPGQVSEVVTVTDAAAADLSSTAVGQNLSDQLFNNVPVQRSVSSLFYLSPGASDSINGGRDNPSIAGGSALDNLYIADGVNITDAAFGGIGTFTRTYGSLGTGINTSFIKEVQVKTGGFEPQYGQSQGGIVNIITQSGTNEYHGSLYGFARPRSFEAERRQADDVRVNKQGKLLSEENYDVGFDFGGYVPGARDKLFFFGSFNPTVRRQIVEGVSANESDRAAGNGDTINSGLFNLLGEHAQRFRTLNYAFKMDYAPSASHQFTFSMFGDPTKTNLSSFRLLNIDTTTAMSRLDFGTRNTALRYNGALTPTWTLSASFSQGRNHFDESGYADVNQVAIRLPIDPVRGNYFQQGIGFVEPTQSTNYRATFDTTKVANFWGSHTFGLGYQFQRSLYSGQRLRSGPRHAIPAANASGIPLTEIGGTPDAIGALFNVQWRLRAQSEACTLCPRLNVRGTDVPVSLQVYRGEFGPPAFDTYGNYHAAYVQDTWRINKYLSVLVGLRHEQERVVGSPDETTGDRYAYSFTGQWAPRIGVTVDPLGRGKTKAWYNYGRFFEFLPLDAAERSLSRELDFTGFRFAPDFTVDEGGVRRVRLGPGGTIVPVVDSAHLLTGATGSGNVPGAGNISRSALVAIAPGTKLGFSDEHLFGFEQQLPKNLVLSVRYQDRRLKRIIEDAAILSPEAANAGLGQTYFIGNINSRLDAATNVQQIRFTPAFDADGHITNAPAGCFGGGGASAVFVTEVTPGNAVCLGPTGIGPDLASLNTPDGIPDGFVDPVRIYRAFEFELNKRFSNGWQMLSNFRVASLRGNYEGHLRNDNGQTDPGISSLFDFTAGDFNLLGDQFAVGPLNTDRRFIANFYGNYTFGEGGSRFGGRGLRGLNLGAGLHMESGVPISEFLAHPVYLNAGEVPVGGRGKLGRTPFYTKLDLHADYPIRMGERTSLRLIADFFNVTNSRKLLYPDQFRELDLGAENPDFLQPSTISLTSGYRLPFSMRLGARFEF